MFDNQEQENVFRHTELDKTRVSSQQYIHAVFSLEVPQLQCQGFIVCMRFELLKEIRTIKEQFQTEIAQKITYEQGDSAKFFGYFDVVKSFN